MQQNLIRFQQRKHKAQLAYIKVSEDKLINFYQICQLLLNIAKISKKYNRQ